jgi:DNA-binding NtrC family response regulator
VLQGEVGTGTSEIAQLIHQGSQRWDELVCFTPTQAGEQFQQMKKLITNFVEEGEKKTFVLTVSAN